MLNQAQSYGQLPMSNMNRDDIEMMMEIEQMEHEREGKKARKQSIPVKNINVLSQDSQPLVNDDAETETLTPL